MSNYKHWTKEELALLAHLIGTYQEENNYSDILDACEFASKKLGRSKMACYGQYHNKMRGKDLTSFALVEDKGSDYDVDKESVGVVEFLDDLNRYANIGFMNLQDAKETIVVPEINVYSGFKQECKIIVHTDTMIVAEFGGSIITIKF
jgi:hypothetical protein